MQKTYGLDFGASNSTISLVDISGDAVKLPIDPFSIDPTISPTILYYFKNQCFCGSQADALFKSAPVKDRGRIMREIKTCATIKDISGTMVEGRYKEFDEILSDYLSFAKSKADTLVGEKVGRVVIGRPAAYMDSPEMEKLAQERIRKGAHEAGFDYVRFCYEPVAATVGQKDSLKKDSIILTFDFGGSTLDYHLLKVSNNGGLETLAYGGLAFGGNDITRLIFENKVLPKFGSGLEYELKETYNKNHGIVGVPEYRTVTSVLPRILLKYDTTLTAKHVEEAIRLIRGIEWESHRKFDELKRLEICLEKNLVYSLFDSVEETKIQLSEHSESNVRFDKEGIFLHEAVSRQEFEGYLITQDTRVTRSLGDLLAQANVSQNEVEGILTIGGSSKIPYFLDLLKEFFPKAVVYQGDLFGGVAKGLAKIGSEDASEYYVDL